MNVPVPGHFLDFFVLEASDYIDQLDALVSRGGAAGPDAEALQRHARALRGSATMARLALFAELAGGVERVGRALRDGALRWDAALAGALVAAVDDCKILLRGARAWGAAEDARARARASELERYAPLRQPAAPASAGAGHGDFLANEASNVGAGLELLATRPRDRDAAANVLGRLRALRGIASVKDHAALADVLDAAEQAAQPLELGATELGAERIALLGAAATVLRSVAASLRAGYAAQPAEADLAPFSAALDAMRASGSKSERIVPIAELFFAEGPTLVEAAPNPPTSPAERFRLEVVSQAEHLRRLVADARAARDELARERVRRSLREALRALRMAAESFGEQEVAGFVALHNEAAVQLDARALDSLDEVATLLAQPGTSSAPLGERLQALKRARRASAELEAVPAPSSVPAPGPVPSPARVTVPSAAQGASPASIPAPTPIPTPTPARQRVAIAPDSDPATLVGETAARRRGETPFTSHRAIATPPLVDEERVLPAAADVAAIATTIPTDAPARSLDSLLGAGIERLGALRDAPLSAPVALPEQPVVPIDRMLYRGKAAIERCREIRDGARASNSSVQGEALAELLDLLDLALTD